MLGTSLPRRTEGKRPIAHNTHTFGEGLQKCAVSLVLCP